MSQRRLRLRIGIFVASTFVLLGTLIYLFGSFPEIFRSRAGKLYIVEFEDAPGLEVGVPVRRSGVRIGRVEKRELDDETGKVRAWIRIESRYTIRKHEKPTLTTALVSGDVAIDFLPSEERDPDRSPVPAGTVLQGEKPPSVTSLVTRAQQVVSPAQEVLVRISKSLDRLEKISPDLQKALKEYTELGIEVRKLLPDAQKVMRSADRTFTDLNTKYLPELDKTNQEARRLVTSLNTLSINVNAIVPDVGKLVRTLDSTASDAGKLMRDVNTLIPDAQRLLRVTGAAISDVQKLIPEAQKLFREGNLLVTDLAKTSVAYRKLAESADRAIPQLLETNKQAQGLIKGASDAASSVRLAADEYKKLGESLNVLLQTNQESIQNSVKNLEELLKDARKVVNEDNARRINGLLRDLEEAAFRLPSMARNADVILRRVRDSLEKLAGPSGMGGEEARGLLQNLNEAAVKLNRTMSDVQEIVKAAARSDGTLQRLLSDKSLYNSLDDSALMLTRVLPRLDRILKDLEVFADKIARHPESLGIGGAIRPSSGLKEAPNRLYPPPVQGPVIRHKP